MPNFTNNFPDWGDTGTSPPNGFQYSSGDQVREDHLDYLWYEVDTLAESLVNEFERYDSDNSGVVDEAEVAQSLVGGTDAISYKGNDIDVDGDGVVDFAETSTLVKGNDIDSNGDGTVDEADSALTYKNNDIDSDGDGTVDDADSALTYKGQDIDSNGDGTVDEADYANDADASTYKGNDIDSNGDGKVNSAEFADDADTVDGVEEAQLANENVGVKHPVYATTGDVPTSITKGEVVFIDADNSLYVEDGT